MFGENKIRYLGFGSPLMDMIATVDEEFINKHGLTMDTTKHVMMCETNVYKKIEETFLVNYVPGGCSYNTMRVFNWMLKNKNSKDKTGLLGSIGKDFYGNLYTELLDKENILPIFEEYDSINTGVCCVYCHNRDRGHLTDLGASTKISKEFVERIWDCLSEVELIYTELYILKHQKEVVYMLANLALGDNRYFGFNLPSHYFIETYLQDIKNIWECADIIFSNLSEALLFGKLNGILVSEDDVSELSVSLSKMPKKNKNKKRVVIITCGPSPAYVSEYDFITEQLTFNGSFLPKSIDENVIVDTNGAGDAFAGGFLAHYIKNQNLTDSMRAGHLAASIIIQTCGCDIPNYTPNEEIL